MSVSQNLMDCWCQIFLICTESCLPSWSYALVGFIRCTAARGRGYVQRHKGRPAFLQTLVTMAEAISMAMGVSLLAVKCRPWLLTLLSNPFSRSYNLRLFIPILDACQACLSFNTVKRLTPSPVLEVIAGSCRGLIAAPLTCQRRRKETLSPPDCRNI